MFERFTERSRRVVVLAQEEARMLDHNYIGTEHILLGLIHEGDGVASRAIESTGLTLNGARAEVETMIGRGSNAPSGHIPFTPRAKKVLELALREALALRKSYIGPEHILLGLIREADGVGAQILARLAAPLPALREKVLVLAAAEPTESTDPEQDEPMVAEWPYAGPRGPGSGFLPRPRAFVDVRTQVITEFRETLASLGETLTSLDRRLAEIEHRLGIAAEEPAEEEPAEEEPAEEEPAEEEPAEEEPADPAEEAPEESAE
jgi:ATP-dependent Clp protease ATP-binding subunit ClpA